LEELEQALANGAEAILLDNMSVEDVGRAVERCTKLERRLPLECSGGIRLENVRAYAETGVDFISVGVLTHSAPATDMRLRFEPVRGMADDSTTTRARCGYCRTPSDRISAALGSRLVAT